MQWNIAGFIIYIPVLLFTSAFQGAGFLSPHLSLFLSLADVRPGITFQMAAPKLQR